jgi:phosphoribosylamine--glycine ligase
MKILVIGSGGREHAIAWRLAQSPKVSRVFVAPGNAGTAREEGLHNVDLNSIAEWVKFAKADGIHATVVGPEAPLAAGVVDAFRAEELRVFGPSKAAAQLEASKDFA